MIEKQYINQKDVWLKVEPWHIHRDNPHIIPTEYFTVSYYLAEPIPGAAKGELMKDEHGEAKLFESPVAAINFASEKLQQIL
jgi:hypothetical protein